MPAIAPFARLPGGIIPGGGTIYAYCHDMFGNLGSDIYTVLPGGANALTLDLLGSVNALLGGADDAWLKPGSATIAAAIRLGIREPLYDGDFNLRTGTFKASGVESATLAHSTRSWPGWPRTTAFRTAR